ncbi:MAG: heavy metal translocating P-type ATPase [Planctomycetota bacterium]
MTVAVEPAAPAEVTCTHCGLHVPTGMRTIGTEHQFCCAGCRAVYMAIHESGLDKYYELRDAVGTTGKQAKSDTTGAAAFDADAFTDAHVRELDNNRRQCDLLLEGVTCAACVWLVEKLPKLCPGVIDARLSLHQRTARITWHADQTKASAIATALARLGYTAHPPRRSERDAMIKREERRRLIDIGIAAVCAGNIMLLAFALYGGDFAASGDMAPEFRELFRWLSTGFGVVSLAWPGRTFFKGALAAIRSRTANLDLPIAIALLVGGVAGLTNVVLGRGDIYFDSLAVLVFLLLCGRFIQHRQQRRAAETLSLMGALVPSTCRVVDDAGETHAIPVDALVAGQRVEVLPGAIVPGDGVIDEVAGTTSFDQALLTGESEPVTAEAQNAVWAGAKNLERRCVVQVGAVGADTRVGRLMNVVEQAVDAKAPVVQFADRVAGWFTTVMIFLGLSVGLGWGVFASPALGIDHAVALLIVACPCALGLATPLTLAVALARSARRDLLIKGAAALEQLSQGGTLVLDKTGTLTQGKIELARWEGDENLRPLIAAAERHSGHHLAKAIVEAWGDLEPTTTALDATDKGNGGIEARVGDDVLLVGSVGFLTRHGVSLDDVWPTIRRYTDDGLTPVVATLGGEVRMVIGFGDCDRPDAADTIATLRDNGWDIEVLSGDVPAVVEATARRLGIDRSRGGVTPEEKADHVQALRDAGKRVVMVGDGVNDAAALAAADVGIAVAGGAEASLLAADVYAARPGLSLLAELTADARRTMRHIRRNLRVSLTYNIIAVSLAAAGLITPLVAAIIMPISSATVVALALAGGVSRRKDKP